MKPRKGKNEVNKGIKKSQSTWPESQRKNTKILNYGHKWEKRTKEHLPIFSANKQGPTEVHIGWDLCLQPGTPSSSNPPQGEDWNTKDLWWVVSEKFRVQKKQEDNSSNLINLSVTDWLLLKRHKLRKSCSLSQVNTLNSTFQSETWKDILPQLQSFF